MDSETAHAGCDNRRGDPVDAGDNSRLRDRLDLHLQLNGWWLWLPVFAVLIAIILLVLPWCQFIPYFVRPMVPLAMIVAAGHARGPFRVCACAAFLLAAWVLIRLQLNSGSRGHEAIEISPPFASGVYFVGQGGGNSEVNHHFRNESQRFALDIFRLNWLTMRGWGFFPRRLGRYAIYNTEVLCPVSDVVTAVVDGLPEMEPLVEQDAANIAGNNIVVRCAIRPRHLHRVGASAGGQHSGSGGERRNGGSASRPRGKLRQHN